MTNPVDEPRWAVEVMKERGEARLLRRDDNGGREIVATAPVHEHRIQELRTIATQMNPSCEPAPGGRRVYVSGPITLGDLEENVNRAIDAADQLLRAGFHPFVPHLDAHWHARYPHEHHEWLALDMAWLPVCDALIRLPGPSAGADIEVQFAAEHGIPVYSSVEDLIADLGPAKSALGPVAWDPNPTATIRGFQDADAIGSEAAPPETGLRSQEE